MANAIQKYKTHRNLRTMNPTARWWAPHWSPAQFILKSTSDAEQYAELVLAFTMLSAIFIIAPLMLFPFSFIGGMVLATLAVLEAQNVLLGICAFAPLTMRMRRYQTLETICGNRAAYDFCTVLAQANTLPKTSYTHICNATEELQTLLDQWRQIQKTIRKLPDCDERKELSKKSSQLWHTITESRGEIMRLSHLSADTNKTNFWDSYKERRAIKKAAKLETHKQQAKQLTSAEIPTRYKDQIAVHVKATLEIKELEKAKYTPAKQNK